MATVWVLTLLIRGAIGFAILKVCKSIF